ncbi:peptidoglycan-binding protein [Streptomyces sp. CRN 30]|uniref:COG1470 family protein n=1 Tax=Streptomyces sp. CRN 30 TaxID=3075613 RepID=UPI002A7ED8CD|nr:peptidoglycan-binding protein [Streptomyces sp. CRN 30]
MSLWTSFEPAAATVDPGADATVRLRLRNTGDIVDEYRLEPVGDLAPWTTVEPPTLRLYPGTTGTALLTFAPPRGPEAAAGPHPYALRVVPTAQPGATTVVEGVMTVTSFVEVRAELVPPTVKGWFRGRPRLAVDNLGNTPLTASLTGSDRGAELGYELTPGNVRIEPGRAAFVRVALKPRGVIWFGAKEERLYSLHVHRSGAEPHTVDGSFVQRGVLPRWLATCLGMSVALGVAFVALWFGYQPQVRSLATERTEEVAADLLPGAVPSPSDPAGTKAPLVSPDALPGAAGEQDGDGGPGAAGGEGSGSSGGSGTSKADGGQDTGEQGAAAGPLPFRAGDGPNLFVQFAQVRMAGANASDPCRLTAPVRSGVMDAATVAAVACFQKASDARYDGVTVASDGAGNLGRSTMTALLMAHFGTSTSSVGPGADNPDVVWMNSVLLWADNVQYDGADIDALESWVTADIHYLRSADGRASATADDGFAQRVASCQRALGLEATGEVDAALFAALHAGRVKDQDQPGQVTAENFPPAPTA